MIKRLIKRVLLSVLPNLNLDAEYDEGLLILSLKLDEELIWHQIININKPNR